MWITAGCRYGLEWRCTNVVCASRHGAHGSSEQHARISAPLCPIHVYSMYIYTYVHTGSTCMPRCVDGRSHTRTHTRMREVQARLILPDRATCIYCALFRACAFFRDVREREREISIDDSGKSMLPFALFFERRGGVLFSRFLFWRSRQAGKSEVTKRWCKRRPSKSKRDEWLRANWTRFTFVTYSPPPSPPPPAPVPIPLPSSLLGTHFVISLLLRNSHSF